MLLYDINTSVVEALVRKINVAMRKWLGVPPGMFNVALYCKKAKLVVPLKFVTNEFKIRITRLGMMLWGSANPNVGGSQPTLKTGRKWKVSSAIESTQQSLELKEVMGFIVKQMRSRSWGGQVVKDISQ